MREQVAASGVFEHGEIDLGTPQVMDAGTTSVRALGPDGEPVEVREQLAHLVDDLQDMLPREGDSVYQAERLAVYRLDAVYSGDSTGPPLEWPGAASADLFDGEGSPVCALIEGEDVGHVLEAAQRNPGFEWQDDEGTFFAVVTIVLSSETPCER